MKNKFMGRTLTSVILIAMLAAFMICGYFVSSIFIDLLILLFMTGASLEMYECLKAAGYKMQIAPIIIMLILAYPVFFLMQYFIGAGVQGLLIVLLVSVMVCLSIFTFHPAKTVNADRSEENECESTPVKPEKSVLSSLFANVSVLVYPTLFLASAWIISYKYSAFFAVLFAIFVPIIGSDMFAYFVGSAIGGKKLCPSVSPKKTVAGAIGGLFGAMIVAIIFWAVFEYAGSASAMSEFIKNIRYVPFVEHSDGGWMWKSAMIYLAIGLVCGVISELGDLAASSIKRALGIKDYGKIFPGHGGVMDRIDSVMYCLVVLLIAFPCIYGC